MKSTAKGSQKSSWQQNIRLILIFGAVFLAAAAIVVLSIILPSRIKAKRCLDEINGILNASETCELILVSDLKSSTDILGVDSGEVLLSDVASVAELAEKLDSVIDGMKYSFSKNMNYGSWGIRLRFYVSDEKYEIYLEEERLYILDGNKGYYFVPKSTDGESEYAETYAYVLALIGKQITE